MTTHKRLTLAQRKEISREFKRGRSIAGLASDYKRSRGTIERWVAEGKEKRPNWGDQPRSGRPRLLSTPERSSIRRAALAGRTVVKIAASVNKNRAQPVSKATVRRVVQSGPHPQEWKPARPKKELRAANVQQRVEFCRSNLRAQTHNWVFVDSKFLYVYETKQGYLHFRWQDKGRRSNRHYRSNPLVLHFYAAVAFGHKSKLYFTAPTLPWGCKDPKQKENFCSRHFIKVMQRLIAEVSGWYGEGRRWVLIMDHAKQHTSKASKRAMEELEVPIKQGFPAQCWDINIIENVWGLMDGKLLGRRARTVDGWRCCCKEAFKAVKQSSINKLVDRVKPRLQAMGVSG